MEARFVWDFSIWRSRTLDPPPCPFRTHIYSLYTHSTGRHAIESRSVRHNVSLCSQTQSVNVRGPSSLSPGLARCQTAFLRQLPFLTSAALTWFHLTVVRNLFSFSVMKYYTETPGLALLYVLFVIPRLSLCYEWLWLLFYSAVFPVLLLLLLLLQLQLTTAGGNTPSRN